MAEINDSDSPGKDEFAQMMADAIRAAGESGDLRYDADSFSLSVEGGPTNILYLTNAYAEYRTAAKDGRQGVVRRFVRTWFTSRRELPGSFTDARPDLLPGVRGRAVFELTPLRMKAEGKEAPPWPYQVLAGHLGVGLVYDLPDSMMQLQQERLDRWGVTLEETLEAAAENLLERSGEDFEQPAPGVWLSPWRDNYDAARLVLPGLLSQYEVQGDIVAAVPNRDVLVFTGSDDEEGLEQLFALIEEQMEKPRPLSALPVRLDGDVWLPYRPGPDSPLYERFRLLQVQSVAQDYANQAEVLKALHERTDEDVFVASYLAVRREGRVMSYCVWSEGVDTMLPQADEVFFFRPDGKGEGKVVARGNWSQVIEVAGELCDPCGLYPERYRVRAFPSDDQLAAIGGVEEEGE